MPLYSTSEELLYNLEATTSSEAKRKWRQSIKGKWNYECAYCGSEENLTLDHITPRSKGGSDRVTNVLCACHSCNHLKGHKTWYDWYMQLSRRFLFQVRQQNLETSNRNSGHQN